MLYTKRVTLVFLTQFICTLAFVVYCLLILINFVEMFHTNLSQLHRKRDNDSWLQARCKEQEFVNHIRHHIDLCETVERDALTNVYLTAIQMALDGLHLCGSYSCEKILISLTESLRLSIYTWIATVGVVVVILPLCVLPLYRRWQRNLLLYENHLGDNSVVPSVYIRDGTGNMFNGSGNMYNGNGNMYSGNSNMYNGNMYNLPSHSVSALSASSQSAHYITEPRHRRLLCDPDQNTGVDAVGRTANDTLGNQTNYLPHSHHS